MVSRRSFFRKSATLAGAASLTGISSAALAEDVSDALLALNQLTPEAAAEEEDLWARMAQSFTVTTNILNLNNGGVSPQPRVVQEAVDRYYHLSNEGPTYYMW
ncbi:MAG: aminotransferase, partial [Cyclobacteriaceae bacterium]